MPSLYQKGKFSYIERHDLKNFLGVRPSPHFYFIAMKRDNKEVQWTSEICNTTSSRGYHRCEFDGLVIYQKHK